ncbi:MAG: protein kinase [Candidatus Korobacteraceae bacterium]
MEIKEKIGKYVVKEVLGQGGMGIVYKAIDAAIGRQVAIKMVLGSFSDNPDLLERFYREVKLTANLQHPNIVTVHDWGEEDGAPYIVMEYLEGASLDHNSITAASPQLALFQKLKILVQVCAGLQYAHEKGVVHRDIKPANIFVLRQDQTVKLVDFGIARLGSDRTTEIRGPTRTGQIIGSLHYMSPEQLRGVPVDRRSDIYSAGVVLYQLLTGNHPFQAPDQTSTIARILTEPAPPLSKYISDSPDELEEIVGRSLVKDRTERYQSAEEFAFDLSLVQAQLERRLGLGYLEAAENCIEQSEWVKARENLVDLLKLDRKHVRGNELLREVQQILRRQERTSEAQELKSQAQKALEQRQFEEALALAERASSLDDSNLDLRMFRDSVRDAKERADKAKRVMARAEGCLNKQQLEQAMTAIGEALALDPSNSQARNLQNIIMQSLAKRERLQSLVKDARNEIAAKRHTSALDLLKQAAAIDPDAPEIAQLLKQAQQARAQERQQRELERLLVEIEDAVARKDLVSAEAKIQYGLGKYPGNQELLVVQGSVEKQLKAEQLRVRIAGQVASIRRLMEAGEGDEAVSLAEAAVKENPAAMELVSALTEARELREAQDQERKAETRRQEQLARQAKAETELREQEQREAEIRRAREVAAQKRKDQQRSQAITGLKQLQKSVETAAPTDCEQLLQDATALASTADTDSEIQYLLQQISQAVDLRRSPVSASQSKATKPGPPGIAQQAAAATAKAVEKSAEKITDKPVAAKGRSLVLWGVVTLILVAGVIVALKLTRSGGQVNPVEIRIVSSPFGASIHLEGNEKAFDCVTPNCTLSLLPGTYKVSAALSGYQPVTRTVEATKDTPPIEIALTPLPLVDKPISAENMATLILQTPGVQGASAFVDGKEFTIPGAELRLPAERNKPYSVRVQKDGYEPFPERRVTLTRAQEMIQFRLKPLAEVATITLRRATPNALVLLDERTVGSVAANGSFETKTGPGAHTIQLALEGRTSSKVERQLAARANVVIDSLTVAAQPPSPIPQPGPAPPPADTTAQDWEAARNSNDRNRVEAFLERHPTGPFAEAARAQLEQIDWNAAFSSRDRGRIQGYLDQYRNGRYVLQAHEMLEEIDWNAVKASGDTQKLQAFLNTYPQGRYTALAKAAIDAATNVTRVPPPLPEKRPNYAENESILGTYEGVWKKTTTQGWYIELPVTLNIKQVEGKKVVGWLKQGETPNSPAVDQAIEGQVVKPSVLVFYLAIVRSPKVKIIIDLDKNKATLTGISASYSDWETKLKKVQ